MDRHVLFWKEGNIYQTGSGDFVNIQKILMSIGHFWYIISFGPRFTFRYPLPFLIKLPAVGNEIIFYRIRDNRCIVNLTTETRDQEREQKRWESRPMLDGSKVKRYCVFNTRQTDDHVINFSLVFSCLHCFVLRYFYIF